MEQAPEPPESIPAFLVESLDEQSPATLRVTADYLDGTASHEDVPQKIVEACTLQDDETNADVEAFCRELAAYFESSEHDSIFEGDDDEDSDGEEPPEDTMSLRYGSLG